MALPGNGVFVVRGEISILIMAMKRGIRWNSSALFQDDEQNSLIKSFTELKITLNKIEDLKLIDPNVFLGPFLDVIRSEETTGPITSLALSSINKFLTYGLIDPTHSALAVTVQNIADAVTHARFVGTDTTSDGIVLMKIIQVLRTLMMNPEGSVLTNESICEIMISCFRLSFESRLNDLIRRSAEHALRDMVLLLFMRLPQFSEDRHQFSIKKLKMRTSGVETTKIKNLNTDDETDKQVKENLTNSDVLETENQSDTPSPLNVTVKTTSLQSTPVVPAGNIVDLQGTITQTPKVSTVVENDEDNNKLSIQVENNADVENDGNDDIQSTENYLNTDEYINAMGVRFTQEANNPTVLSPYGLPCVRELFRFLISLCNPLDKQNTDAMMHIALSLLTVAFEVGADSIGKYDTLLSLVKDKLCRNLFSLLNTERLTIFASDLQVCFLLFESLRTHLKFQLEYFLGLLSEIIGSENQKLSYEARELALDNLLQLLRIPGFAAEIFINYDCDVYCTNLFENLTKLLSKTTLAHNAPTIYGIQVIALDALLTVIESIENNCITTKNRKTLVIEKRHSRNSSTADKIFDENASGCESIIENISNFIHSGKDNRGHRTSYHDLSITKTQLLELKQRKQIITQGTELFNNRAEKGIQFLMENGILSTPLDPNEVAYFLRENAGLDKKMIGEYISKKKNVESKILESFVKSFDFSNTTIDKAMRLYLEAFRLPGEAPLIFLVVEHFADHWHKCNNEPFANTDAAFKIAYSIIMLNMDQHNHNAKRLNVPMTVEDYLKNLRGLNGTGDFDQETLRNIFHAIKNDEIVMPAEQTGIVRENYLWKVLLRRGMGKDGFFIHLNDSGFDKELFEVIWGSTLTALSYIFDKTNDNSLIEKSKYGFIKCASISSYFGLHENFDAVILILCKFSTIFNIQYDVNETVAAVSFGQNPKAQEAIKCAFNLVHEHGDCMREGWKNILDIILTLFRLKLLPKYMLEVEDFCDPSGKIILNYEKPQLPKVESGIFSSLYSYLANDSQRIPTFEEQEIIKKTKKLIKDCQIDQILTESKFLQFESLQEIIKAFLIGLHSPDTHKSLELSVYPENEIIFLLEVLVKILIQNRDRVISLWGNCRDAIYLLLVGAATCGYDDLLIRTTTAIMKLAIYLMRNEELCPIVLQSLNMFLMLKPNVIYRISKQISCGMYELLKTSAQNIHTESDWAIVFTILECVGAGALPPDFIEEYANGTKSDGAISSEEDSGVPDRGYTSDSELSKNPVLSPSGENWILVNKENDKVLVRPSSPINSLAYPCKLSRHSPFALVKCWDCLAFIVRNVAHITPYNFENCVKCIRTFVEASLNNAFPQRNSLNKNIRKKKKDNNKQQKPVLKTENLSDSESEDNPERYQTIAIQLLDLMHTLHTRTAQIFRWWAEEGGAVPQYSALWEQGWRPILQGISRLALDQRRHVRTSAITCLQKSLLVHDLQSLTGPEWSSCFKTVLFPLLTELLNEQSNASDPSLLEESRMRTATIMSKVFLHHLTPLITLSNFNDLWLEILEYLEKFMNIGTDMLYEALLESLKNMLLVMHSVRVFHTSDGHGYSELWNVTWKRIGSFLPNLKQDLFKSDEESQDFLQILPPSNVINTTNSAEIHTLPTVPENVLSVPETPSIPIIQNNSIRYTTVSIDLSNNQDNVLTKNSIILQPPAKLLNQPLSSSPLLVPHSENPVNVPVIVPQQYSLQEQHIVNSSSGDNSPSFNDDKNIPVPISHVLGVNQYPGLSRNIPTNIAQSYAPLYVCPSNPTKCELYNDYVNNPYNLTLEENFGVQVQEIENKPNEILTLGASNVFQSVNYFETDCSNIPPGSEMLFSRK